MNSEEEKNDKTFTACFWFYESEGISVQYLVPVDVSSIPLSERLLRQRWRWNLTLSLLFLQDHLFSQSRSLLQWRILLSSGLLLTDDVFPSEIKSRTALLLSEPTSPAPQTDELHHPVVVRETATAGDTKLLHFFFYLYCAVFKLETPKQWYSLLLTNVSLHKGWLSLKPSC